MLGLSSSGRGSRFIAPFRQVSFTLKQVIGELQRDPWPIEAEQRAQRATGSALALATGLLEALCGTQTGRILLMTSGPCTIGPGQVVAPALKEAMRSHHDIDKDHAPYFKSARLFNNSIKERLTGGTHSWGVDVFVASYDQVGLFEMNELIEKSGGVMVLSDAFGSGLFLSNFLKFMEMTGGGVNGLRDPNSSGNILGPYTHLPELALHGTFEVLVSKELRVSGAIGPLTSLHKKSNILSDSQIGTQYV